MGCMPPWALLLAVTFSWKWSCVRGAASLDFWSIATDVSSLLQYRQNVFWVIRLRVHFYHEVSIARVKRLRRLCAKFAARAKESARRCRHLDCDASICLSAIAREQES